MQAHRAVPAVRSGSFLAPRRARALTAALAVALAAASLPAPATGETPPRPRSLKEIRERGVVMQRWETSCAAAAVATVLTFAFQDPVSETHVATRMLEGTSAERVRARGGFSLLDMQRFVAQRGYEGAAYQRLTLDDLRLFRAPIVPISVHGYNHYVVVNAIDDRQVMLADPAFGNRTMPLARFEEAWLNGLAFVVSRGAEKKS